jgi:Secretion system C-terminal sorting domain
MKKSIFLLLLLINCLSFGQAIHFEYDNAGNQIVRQLCLTCSSKSSGTVPKTITSLKKEDLKKFNPEDNFSYYPNPVKEELYLNWELKDNTIATIQLYTLNGVLLKSFDNLQHSNSQNISFQEYPTGIYGLVLHYTKGEEKSVKIIKQ